jgi:hypothetical protein
MSFQEVGGKRRPEWMYTLRIAVKATMLNVSPVCDKAVQEQMKLSLSACVVVITQRLSHLVSRSLLFVLYRARFLYHHS